MADYLSFALDEASNSDCCFTMAKVDERNYSGVFYVELLLSEETILQCDGSALVNYSQAFQSCNFASIK